MPLPPVWCWLRSVLIWDALAQRLVYRRGLESLLLTMRAQASDDEAKVNEATSDLRRVLVQCAWGTRKTATFLGWTFRRLEVRIGKKKAALAVAHNVSDRVSSSFGRDALR